jgi:predicted RNA-binding Zn-ribbon protein involved in translation (DUF1610 family)
MNRIRVMTVLVSTVKRPPKLEVIIGFRCPNCGNIHYKVIRDVAPLPTEMVWKLRCGFVHFVSPWQDELPVAGQSVESITSDCELNEAEE